MLLQKEGLEHPVLFPPVYLGHHAAPGCPSGIVLVPHTVGKVVPAHSGIISTPQRGSLTCGRAPHAPRARPTGPVGSVLLHAPPCGLWQGKAAVAAQPILPPCYFHFLQDKETQKPSTKLTRRGTFGADPVRAVPRSSPNNSFISHTLKRNYPETPRLLLKC